MDKRQTMLLLGVIFLVVMALVVVGYFLQGEGNKKSGGIATASKTRLQLSSSKPRQSLTITSKRTPTTKTTKKSGAKTSQTDPATSGMPKPEAARKPVLPPGGAVVQDAMNAASPEEGIKLIDASLQEEPPPIKAAHYHSAKAVLAAQQTPPDLTASEASFEEALRIAPDLATEQSVRLQQAQLLLQQDAQDRAMAVIEAALAQQGEPGQETLQLYLLQGTLLEKKEAITAEAAYGEAIELARTLFPNDPELSAEMLQVAAFRLARLYRAQGKNKEAETLSRKVRAYLEMCMAQQTTGNELPPLLE